MNFIIETIDLQDEQDEIKGAKVIFGMPEKMIKNIIMLEKHYFCQT